MSDSIIQEDAFQLPTYTKMPVALVRGEGCYVWDAEGAQYLDFYGGHCVTPLGHCPPRVVEAVQQQVAQLIFYSNATYSPVRASTAELLASMVPEGLGHVFLCNSGSEANETALKLARTWTGKSGVIAMKQGFHGRTLGSLATTHGEKYRKPYLDVLPPTTFVPFGDASAVADALDADDDVAAIILEPIQSMAGIVTAPTDYFEQLRELCDAHGVALIFDEVQTGVGRTGTFSISEHLGVQPDLISMAKSLGSGLPVGCTFVSDAINATVESGDHGSTFGGGMVAMAAVAATIETIEAEGLMDHTHHVFEQISEAAAPHVEAVRGQGCLIGLEFAGPAAPIRQALLDHHVLTGSSGDPNVLRLMPPLNTPDEAIDQFTEALAEAVTAQLASAD